MTRISDEQGSVLLWILGLVAVAATASALLVDVTYMRIERLHADALAEAVAIAAAEQVDLDSGQLLREDAPTRMWLSERAARSAAQTKLSTYPASDLGSRRLISSRVDHGVAAVSVSARIALPFTSAVRRFIGGDGRVTVRSYAAAATYSDLRR